jgi:hypothetical protein
VKLQLTAHESGHLFLNDHVQLLAKSGVDLKYTFRFCLMDFPQQEQWIKVTWNDSIWVQNTDFDDFITFKQEGVLTPYDLSAETPFAMDLE